MARCCDSRSARSCSGVLTISIAPAPALERDEGNTTNFTRAMPTISVPTSARAGTRNTFFGEAFGL